MDIDSQSPSSNAPLKVFYKYPHIMHYTFFESGTVVNPDGGQERKWKTMLIQKYKNPKKTCFT